MKRTIAEFAIFLALQGCATAPYRAPTLEFQAALQSTLDETMALSDAGKLPSLQGFVAEFYLRLQRHVPDMPPPLHAFYRAMLEGAPLVEAGKMTVEELVTAAQLRQLDAERLWRTQVDAARADVWTAAFMAASQGFRPAINCTTRPSGSYTYTTCR